MKQKKQSDIATLLDYAGSHRRLTFLGLGLSAVSMVCSMVPYLCVWLASGTHPPGNARPWRCTPRWPAERP